MNQATFPRQAIRTVRHALSRHRPLPLLLCLFWLCGATAAHALDIDALVGFGQSTGAGARYRPETATPLTIYLTGQGMRGEGQLQVLVHTSDNDGDHTTIYSRRVTLHEGMIKDAQAESFVFYLLPPDYSGFRRGNNTPDINVQLLVDGRQVAHKTVSLPISVPEESYNVLGLTRDGSGLNFLKRKLMGLTHRTINPEASMMNRFGQVNAGPNGINPSATLEVLYTRADALPAIVQGYAMIDAVALADMPLDNLTDAQIDALKGYVRQGGLLIFSGGGDLSRLKSQFYNDMLPIVPSGVLSVKSLPDLEQRYKESLNLTTPIPLLQGTLKPGAEALYPTAGKGVPLVVSRPYGDGTVLFTAFDYIDPTFRGWKAAPSFWRDLLRCGNHAVSPRRVLATAAHDSGRSIQLADALAGRHATNTPEFWTIAIFLCSYIILLIPVSYLVLKRLDKRELSWYTAPLLIGGFTVISYLIALSIKGGSLNVNRAVVLESQANSDQFAGYGQITLYSPRRSSYDISLGSSQDPDVAGHDVSPQEIYNAGSLGTELTVEQNGLTILRNTYIGLWDKRSFELPMSANLGGAIEAVTHMLDHDHAQITVTNKTRYTIKDCAFINGEQTVPLGDLAPGETRQGTLKWAYNSNANTVHPPYAPGISNSGLPYDPRAADTPENVCAKIRYAMSAVMSSNENDGNSYNPYGSTPNDFGRVTNALVGWTTDPLLHVPVDGKQPDGQEVNMIFVHLPAPSNASHALLATLNPFLNEPTLHLEDDRGGGPVRVNGGIFR